MWNVSFAIICFVAVLLPLMQSVEFMIIGDWGKGGSNGKTYNGVDELPTTHDPNGGGRGEWVGDKIKQFVDVHVLGLNSSMNNLKSRAGENKGEGGAAAGGGGGKGGGGGAGQTLNQAAVAKAMASYASSKQQLQQSNPAISAPQFIISVGDNFYTKGVSSYQDPYWDYLYTNIYLSYDSLANLPWYPVLGNHDWGYGYTGVQAQLDRTLHYPEGNWQMPSTNYSRTIDIGDDKTMLLVFCDTTTIAPYVNDCCNSKRLGT